MAFQEAFGSVNTALPSFTAKSARSTGVTLFGLSTVLTAFKSLLKSDFQLFNDGGDLDVYFCEADWALKYINDDNRTLALSKLGLGDKDFANIYSYTDEIGKDSNGVRKGVSWQAAAGGFAYRADLAEEYLGVKSPEEMQAKIDDWDLFVRRSC